MRHPFSFLVSLACGLALVSVPEAPAQDAERRADEALAGLEVAEGLAVTLFASEPVLFNPTNIDIDAKGRVWVCEGVNYRPALNPQNPQRPEGDRILILEDTDGDGRADREKVYYQGPDVNAALGIAVLGNRVIVSVSPNIFVFTDEDGDDRPDRKEIFFTGLSGEQHDHAVHAFVFGPDGKLYFNFGNAGGQVRDATGNLVVDVAGNAVTDDGNPYREGMVFRLNPDGSAFEVLGYNFRNNYEVAVDAYGTIWQSDNDDDGNRSVRINYVMEYGNYGYKDEMTGASWWVRRTGMESEIPFRHWHQNDPGVVPNLLITGAGSPTGLVIYEGKLLPAVFQGQMIHTDAGPNVVRAYPVREAGAGYEADVVNILKGERDQWFRPSDVAVAPDGSLIVADWYDPGVGGHQVRDLERGRLFRIAPPGTPYRVPELDLSTPEGAVQALQSPNHATRYLAWTALHAWQGKAEPALTKLWKSDDPRARARALWLLSKIEGRGAHFVGQALADADPNLRITGLRAARQIELDVIPLARMLADDPSPQVRREVALALRHNPSPEAARLWADLAARYDGRDRWYLEAMGIGADRQWEDFFAAWLERAGQNWDTPAGRDLVWRSRAKAAIPMLAQLVRSSSPTERLRYFRAFDFHRDPSKQEALLSLLDGDGPDQAQITSLVLRHLDPAGAAESPRLQTALAQTLAAAEGTQEYVDIVGRYELRDRNEALARLAVARADSSLGVEAAQLLLRFGATDVIQQALNSDDPATIRAMMTALGAIENARAKDLLEAVVTDPDRDVAVRRMALQRLGRGRSGEDRLLQLVKAGRLTADLEPTAAGVLFNAYRQTIREEAGRHLKPPETAAGRTLPPIAELARRTGNPAQGEEVFATLCSACHQVNRTGTEFGPNLSEIGGKLPKEGLYVAILHPDAGISFGYEGFVLRMKDGSEVLGYIANETADQVEVRMPGGASARYDKNEIANRIPYEHSLMPSNLQQAMTETELVDLVEYLTTLRKAGN